LTSQQELLDTLAGVARALGNGHRLALLERLRQLGYRVRRFEEGYPEWKAAGLPVSEHSAAGTKATFRP